MIQAAERLHVDPSLIEALEAERFEELGASVYVRGHVRRYADLVGESPGELHALYSTSAHSARTPDLTRVPKSEESVGASSALLVPAVLVVIVVAVIGTVWWIGGTLSLSPSRAAHSGGGSVLQPARAVASRPAAAVSPVGAPPVAGAAGGGGATAGGGGVVGAAGAVGASGSGRAAGTPRAVLPAPGPERAAALRMHFAEDSWAEVYDARGQRLFYDTGSADSTRTVSGTPPLKIVLGNPAGVSLELDGRPVSIPSGAERNVSVRFRITSSGHAAPAHLAAAADRHASTASVQAP